MASPNWHSPGRKQGRVHQSLLTVASPTDGEYLFVLGEDEQNDSVPHYVLDIGQEITVEQTFDIATAQRLLRMAWRMSSPRDMPQARTVVAPGQTVVFRKWALFASGDHLTGLYVPQGQTGIASPPFSVADERQRVTVSGATSPGNNGTFMITGVGPNGQGTLCPASNMAIIYDNGGMVSEECTAATVRILGARWVARAYFNNELRAELSEPAGRTWQRGNMAMHISQFTGAGTAKFSLKLEELT